MNDKSMGAAGVRRPGWATLGVAAAVVVVVGMLITPASAAGGSTTRVSVDSTGAQANHGATGKPDISADGRFVAFASNASNLVPGDNNGEIDAFVYDRLSRTTDRVSVDLAGGDSNGWSGSPSISADGRFVAFHSSATNLVAGGAPGLQVYVRDRATGVTELVSRSSDGESGNNFSKAPAITPDGRYVAFTSEATNLVNTDDVNEQHDIFVHDRLLGNTELITADSAGNAAGGSPGGPRISADGRFVVFASYASLVPGDSSQHFDVFVHDRHSGITERITNDSEIGLPADFSPSISADGRYVSYTSSQPGLVADDGDADSDYDVDVFVHDRATGLLERVSVAADGGDMNGWFATYSVVSADGRFVAFCSDATNLVAGSVDDGEVTDVFVRDRATDTTYKASVNAGGNGANGGSWYPAISEDGRHIAFMSDASNLVDGDTNDANDVFVHAWEPPTDSDGDGVSDGNEQAAGTDPLDADSDDDGIDDGAEADLGTHPLDADSDDDGIDDGAEADLGTDPLDADSDDDGIDDGAEADLGTDPLDADSDDDGIDDGQDVEGVQNVVSGLPDSSFKGASAGGKKSAINSILDEVEAAVASGDIATALQKLENLRKHLDGCGVVADLNDWVQDCTDQQAVRALIDLLIANLS